MKNRRWNRFLFVFAAAILLAGCGRDGGWSAAAEWVAPYRAAQA